MDTVVCDLEVAFLRLILPDLMTCSKDLSNGPIYAVLNTHNLDMILQLKFMPIVMTESGQNRLEWLEILEMLWSVLRRFFFTFLV